LIHSEFLAAKRRKKLPILPAVISRAPTGASHGAGAFEIFVTFGGHPSGYLLKNFNRGTSEPLKIKL
jgi:hypothetical protein